MDAMDWNKKEELVADQARRHLKVKSLAQAVNVFDFLTTIDSITVNCLYHSVNKVQHNYH